MGDKPAFSRQVHSFEGGPLRFSRCARRSRSRSRPLRCGPRAPSHESPGAATASRQRAAIVPSSPRVELVAEEVAEKDRARPDAPRHLRQRRLVDLEQAELCVAGVRAGSRRSPRRGWPRRRCGRSARAAAGSRRFRGRVVFPFVAETTTEPSGSRAASRSTAPGSCFQRSFPGSVVPPPRPATRESAPAARSARPRARAEAARAPRKP